MNDISSESANAVVDERCLSPPENGDEAAAGTERDADESVVTWCAVISGVMQLRGKIINWITMRARRKKRIVSNASKVNSPDTEKESTVFM